MIALVAIIAAGSLGLSLFLLGRVAALARRLESAERMLSLAREAVADDVKALENPKPLEGLRVSLSVTQDHAHPIFATLLKEQLLREDVSEVTILPPSVLEPTDSDILIAGSLTCNGYAEVYYQAEFKCYTQADVICTVIERPPGGDRPENLAMELVTKLNTTLETLVHRTERRRAISELHGL